MLIDTGFGNEDIRDPKGRIGAPRFLLRPALSVRETAIAQVAELGLDPKDVRTILLTHADVDHIGGLTDFPWAEVYLHAQELQSFASPRVWSDKNRYRPAGWLKERGVHAVTLSSQTAWQGLDAALPLAGRDDVVMVSLPGHSAGHAGIALRQGDGWLLHAGDSFYSEQEIVGSDEPFPRMTRWMQRAVATDMRALKHTQSQLRALRASLGDSLEIVNAHDSALFERFAAR